MRLFIDSALPKKWTPYAEAGLIHGVTTNPSIFRKENISFSAASYTSLIHEARAMGLEELQLQVTETSIPRQAVSNFMRFFEQWPEGIIAKIPFRKTTLEILSLLPREVPITFTTGYSIEQAVIARAKNARYIAPYYGRILEQGKPADAIVDSMLNICKPHTRVLIASIRNTSQIHELASRGHDTFTLSAELISSLFHNELSEHATAEFEAAAQGQLSKN